MPHRHLVAPAGLDFLILPIGVVDLQLHKFRLREVVQYLIQHLRRVVEGEAQPADASPRFLGQQVFPDPIILHRFEPVRAHGMQ